MAKKIKIDKVIVSWAFGTNPIMQIDFGRFPAHKLNQFQVDEKFWHEYCDTRFKFELMQKKLCELVEGRTVMSERIKPVPPRNPAGTKFE